jgi:hypothetical protein
MGEVAELLRIGRTNVYDLVASGEIPGLPGAQPLCATGVPWRK